MTQPEQVRVRYREGQRLTVDDLTTEQDYLIATRRRHDLSGHGPGVVRGLRVSIDAGGFTVEPGMAVDDGGRVLASPEPLRTTWAELPAEHPGALDLWLRHEEEASADRVAEGVTLLIVPVAEVSSRVAAPTAPPAGTAVYLGRLAATGDGQYEPVPTALTYPPAVAEVITAQTGTSLLLGVDPVLAVRAPGDAGPPLAVGRSGAATVTGPLASAEVDLQPTRPLRFAEPVAEPAAASPWRWYRTDLRSQGVITGRVSRVELGAPTSTDVAAWYRFTVAADPAGENPPLTVDAGAVTTVGGDLTVLGSLVYAPLGDDPEDSRLAEKLLGTWVDAVAAASSAVDARFTGSGLVVEDALELLMAPATTPVVDDTFFWELVVHNTTDDLVTGVTVATLTEVGSEVTQDKPVEGQRLAAGDRTAALVVDVPLPADIDRVHVMASAFGVLPGGQIAFGTAVLDWRRPEPPPNP